MQFLETPNYILDTQTKKGERMTSFALEIKDALLDFQKWVDEIKLSEEDIWYADVFEFVSQKHIAVVHLDDRRLAIISQAPADSKVKLFKRNRFIAKLKGELK